MTEPPEHFLRGPTWNLDWPRRAENPRHQETRTADATAAHPLRPFVFFFCRLGDMVMLTAMLRSLHRRYHLPSYVVGAGSWNAAVYEHCPDVAGLWSFHRHLPFVLDPRWLQLRRALRASAPGPIYVCERHYRQLPRIRRMLALSGVDPARCVFLSDEAKTSPMHLVDQLMRLAARTPAAVRASEYPLPQEPEAGPRLCVSERERIERDGWLRAQGWAGRELILVQPGNHRSMSWRRRRWRRTSADDKAWPLERWVGLLRRIHAQRREALLVLRGAREEVPMLREIQAAAGLDAVVVAGDSLREFFALCEAAHSMISVDTGPAHAAAALGLPLVVLYGAESPLHWLPRSPTGSPVLEVVGRPPSTRVDQIPVEAVFDAWCTLLQTVSASTATPTSARARSVRARQAAGSSASRE